MGSNYQQAVSALYRAPHESFVAERRRLAEELKAEGDKLGAAQLAKMGRPPISAWVVNQLWWHARDAFNELFDTAAQLRTGKHWASPAHRQAIARLGARAQQLLSDGGHSANDATLRRVTMTLSGLAAAGSFEPDSPGALTKDRDPPGFEAFGVASSNDVPVASEPAMREKSAPHARAHPAKSTGKARETPAAAKRKHEAEVAAAERKREAEAAAAERKREAEAHAKRQAQRKKLESELRNAKAELAEREHERERMAKQLTTAEREVERARAGVDAAQAELDSDRAS
ncbi:MAG: hypothetical protein WDO69_15395 [Pseudomonadota bacterium]